MLRNRVENDAMVPARLSHAIRRRTSESNWLRVNSTNLDEMLKEPLPGISKKREFLIRWIAGQLRDNHLGWIASPNLEHLAGVVGAENGEQVAQLLEYAQNDQIIKRTSVGDSIGLSPQGWSALEEKLDLVRDNPQEPPGSPRKIVKSRCNRCGGERNFYVIISYVIRQKDGETLASDTYDLLECCGCNGVSMRQECWFSEWDTFEADPLTGLPRMVPGIRTTYWPPPLVRQKPIWANQLKDEVLRKLIDEVYGALNSDLIVLALMGTRTLLDTAMVLLVGDSRGGFAGKLQAMVGAGHISESDKDVLEVMTDAGSAAAHRGYQPKPETFSVILSTIENFLERTFILKHAAGDVRASTPPRH